MTEQLLHLIDPVLSYLSPVDFMHTIEASKYLCSRYKSKIQEKRKESLKRFIEHMFVENLHRIEAWRGTKLPNGRDEGKFEMLTEHHYVIGDYSNGEIVGHKFIYDYIQCGDEKLSESNKKLLRDDLSHKFDKWEHIDISEMRLVITL